MKNSTSKSMMAQMKDLWNLNRSICGPGLRNSILYFKNMHPELNVMEIETGSDLGGGWVVPKEWELHECYIEDMKSKKRFAMSTKSNLHAVNYSTSFEGVLSWNELAPHIHTIPNIPDAIPYITSYYREAWGICIEHKEIEELSQSQKLRVTIKTTHKPGHMTLADCVMEGESSREIMFSSYLCHPQLANNELSGPIVLSEVMQRIKARAYRRFSYRFILGPETLGAIAYIHINGKEMKEKTAAGFVLSCVGDGRAHSCIHTPESNTLADLMIEAALIGKRNAKKYDYKERGSDERHYSSAGLELPVVGYCRSKYGTYQEYHTSHDDMTIVSESDMQESAETLIAIVDALELCSLPRTTINGEPFLSKFGLYDTNGHQGELEEDVRYRMDILAYSNGIRSIFEICTRCGIPLRSAINECLRLSDLGLLQLDIVEI